MYRPFLMNTNIHFLQPNPFVPDSKDLTNNERQLVKSGLSFQNWVISGYPKLQIELNKLVDKGVVAEDLTEMFRSVDGDIWIDGAHTNNRGSRLVVERIVDLLSNHKALVMAGKVH